MGSDLVLEKRRMSSVIPNEATSVKFRADIDMSVQSNLADS